MKKLLPFIAVFAVLCTVAACSDDDDPWDKYEEWRLANDAFYEQQAAQSSFYTRLAPSWYPGSRVLIHYFNDRSLTAGNLTPNVNSTVDAKYKGWLYNNEAFDSSYTNTANGDSIFRFKPTETIAGWQIALSDMRVGDSARVVIPWAEGYGTSTSGSIPPFSTLVFDIKLVDIVALDVEP